MLENYDIDLLRLCVSDFDTSLDLLEIFKANIKSNRFSLKEDVLLKRKEHYYKIVSFLIDSLENNSDCVSDERVAIIEDLWRFFEHYYNVCYWIRYINKFQDLDR